MDLWLPPSDARIRSLREGSGEALRFAHSATPLGECAALFWKDHLLALRFVTGREESLATFAQEWPETELLPIGQGEEGLLNGILHDPVSVPLLAFGTPFQLTVWEYLRKTDPIGTITYGELARAIGHPSAARAVGRAVGANGIAVVIPCHRVVSREGLTGYRWGVERKRRLLEWELSRRDPLEIPF